MWSSEAVQVQRYVVEQQAEFPVDLVVVFADWKRIVYFRDPPKL